MTTATKSFPLRDILTVTTGRLLTQRKGPDDNGIGSLYQILEWLTGEPPYTHTLGRFAEECKPLLLAAFPELEAAGSPENLAKLSQLVEDATARKEPPENACQMWLDWMMEGGTIKASYDLPQLARNVHESKNPLAELVDMVGDKKQVAVMMFGKEAGDVSRN